MKAKLLVAVVLGPALVVLTAIYLYPRASVLSAGPGQASPAATPSAPAQASNSTTKPKVTEPDWSALAQQLSIGSEEEQTRVVQQLIDLSRKSPAILAKGLDQWMPALGGAKRFADVERLAQIVIMGRAQDLPTIETAQRARVEAFIGQGDRRRAIAEAKALYNVIELSKTQEALDLFAEAAGLPDSTNAEDAIRATVVHTTSYDSKINSLASRSAIGKQQITRMLARANLLLLANRPADARKCFESLCNIAATQDSARLPIAIEGLARCTRAEFASAEKGNEFVLSLRRGQVPADEASLGETSLLSFAAGAVALADSAELTLPPVEIAREESEGQVQPGAIRVETGFECSTPMEVHPISPTHFQLLLETPGFRDWFLFRVVGAAGRTVRFDVVDPDGNVGKWRTLNPVYGCVDRLSDPEAFDFNASQRPLARVTAFNGPQLPDTSDQNWHFISDCWATDEKTLSFTQEFAGDVAYVGMRVPYPPQYNAAYLQKMADAAKIKLVEVGRSSLQKPLLLAEIGDDQPAGAKPCILAYAGEHADEPDSVWAARGMIDFLTGDSASALDLRRRFVFLVIPMLDPDTAVLGEHERIMTTFRPERSSAESIAYANWFEHWIEEGNRLDVVLDFHNVQSVEEPHVYCPMLEGGGSDRAGLAMALHMKIITALEQAGNSVSPRPKLRGITPDRLGGWLAVRFGPLFLAYEFNSQSPDRHLSLAEITRAGGIFANAVGEFWESGGNALIANVDGIRQARLARWTAVPASTQPANALEAEAWHSATALGGRDVPAGELIVP